MAVDKPGRREIAERDVRSPFAIAVFLASPAACYITGATLAVDGGLLTA